MLDRRPIAQSDRATIRIGVVAGILILLLAGVMRLGWPGIVEFKSDEAALSTLAYHFARGGSLPLLGIPSSVGVPNPPMSVYIMAIPYRLSADPIFATAFVALLNVIAVLLLYLITWRFYGVIAGIVAAILYAADPWAILYSRKIWEQNLLPVFAIALIGVSLLGLIEGRRWAQWAILPLLAICGQLHYGAFVLIPVVLWLIVIGVRRKTVRRGFFGGLLIAGLLTIPYLIGLGRATLTTTTNGSHNQSTPASILTGDGFYNAGLVIGGSHIFISTTGQATPDFLTAVPIAGSAVLPDLIVAAVVAAASWLIVRLVHQWRSADPRCPVDMAVLLWLISTPLAYSIRWTPVFTHYYIVMIPGAFVVLGAAAGDLWQVLSTRLTLRWLIGAIGAIGGLSLITVALIEAGTFVALLGFVDTHVTTGGFGLPLHDLMPMRERALDSGTPAVIAALDGQDLLVSSQATVWNALLAPIASVRFTDSQTTVYPKDRTPVFTQLCQGAVGDAALIAGDPGCFTLINRARAAFDFEAYQPIVPTRAKPSVYFANGVSLLGYRWQVSNRACLDLVWDIADSFIPEPTAPDYFFAVHFTDRQNRAIAIADALSWRTKYWLPGDLVVRTFCVSDVNKAAQITGVQLGMYSNDGQRLHNIDLIDARGTPVNQIAPLYFLPMF